MADIHVHRTQVTLAAVRPPQDGGDAHTLITLAEPDYADRLTRSVIYLYHTNPADLRSLAANALRLAHELEAMQCAPTE